MCRKIVVASGKGGVGKTTVTASVGIGLAKLGHKVLLIDADIGLNNLDVVMGIDHKIVYDMADIISGKCRIKQAVVECDFCSGLFVLPSAHAYSSDEIGVKNFRMLIARLEFSFDFILIDCPAGIDTGFHRAVLPADEALVVTTPHIPAIRDADKVLGLLSSYDMKDVRIIVNRVRGDLVLKGDMMGAMEIAKLLRHQPIGIVPEDDAITIYAQLGRIGETESLSKISFEMIAENISKGTKKLFDCTAQYRGLLGKIKMKFRRDA